MKMNVTELKKVLKKSSINYLIPSVSLKFENGRVWSSSISPENTTIVFLNVEDTVLGNKKEELEFNFSDISSNLKPYLDLIKDEEVDVKITENKLTINDSEQKKFDLFFCTKEFTNDFSGQDKSDSFDYFYENDLTKSIIGKFNEIKKIALRFQKLYFICADGGFYIESTDKNNSFCNSVKFKLDDVSPDLDISMCFDFKNLSYILSTIENDIDNFKLRCTYIKESDAGLALFEHKDKSEKYFITSKSE